MRRIFLSLSMLPVFCTGQTLSPTVIASTGSYFANSGGSLSYTIGEMAQVETFNSPNTILTQGFQQPENSSTGVSEIEGENISITVYPNPASNIVALNYKASKSGSITVNLYDILGRSTGKEAKETVATGEWKTIKFNLASLPSGVYFVKIDYVAGQKERSYTQKISIIK